LKLAVENGIKTIAFPSISTGAYRFPVERAARIAMQEISEFLREDSSMKRCLWFVLMRELCRLIWRLIKRLRKWGSLI